MQEQFIIQNLKCGGCAHTVFKALNSISGVDHISVEVDTGVVVFDYQESDQLRMVKEKLRALGYPLENERNSLITKAQSYLSCGVGRISAGKS